MISRAALKQLSRGESRNLILTLEPQVLDLDSGQAAEQATAPVAPSSSQGMSTLPLSESVDACQRQAIVNALQACGNNWASAARLLQVDPSNLHKLAKRLRLK